MTEPDQIQFGLDFDAAIATTAAELNRKIATCHERHGCPRCQANIGELCTRVSRTDGESELAGRVRALPLKHPHRDRWVQEVPFR